MNKDDIKFINIAIDISKTAAYPYGAIVVRKGKIIGRSDKPSAVMESVFGHAELTAIENCIAELGGNLYAGGGRQRLHALRLLRALPDVHGGNIICRYRATGLWGGIGGLRSVCE